MALPECGCVGRPIVWPVGGLAWGVRWPLWPGCVCVRSLGGCQVPERSLRGVHSLSRLLVSFLIRPHSLLPSSSYTPLLNLPAPPLAPHTPHRTSSHPPILVYSIQPHDTGHNHPPPPYPSGRVTNHLNHLLIPCLARARACTYTSSPPFPLNQFSSTKQQHPPTPTQGVSSHPPRHPHHPHQLPSPPSSEHIRSSSHPRPAHHRDIGSPMPPPLATVPPPLFIAPRDPNPPLLSTRAHQKKVTRKRPHFC